MPKAKSTYPAESDEANGLDPLIEALLGHLPASGAEFEQRQLWMQILDLVLKLVYPPETTGAPNEPEA